MEAGDCESASVEQSPDGRTSSSQTLKSSGSSQRISKSYVPGVVACCEGPRGRRCKSVRMEVVNFCREASYSVRARRAINPRIPDDIGVKRPRRSASPTVNTARFEKVTEVMPIARLRFASLSRNAQTRGYRSIADKVASEVFRLMYRSMVCSGHTGLRLYAEDGLSS
jgi:hypothetical protein